MMTRIVTEKQVHTTKLKNVKVRKISQAYAVTEEQYKLFMDQLDYINTDFPEAYLMYSVNDDLASHTKALDEVLNKVGVAHITKAYGQNNPDSGHIFHMNMYNPEEYSVTRMSVHL